MGVKTSPLDFLKKLHDELLKCVPELEFDKEHVWCRHLVALYGSMIELSGCLIILLDKRGNIGVPAIVRTFLETSVEFNNLLKEKAYGYSMEASYHHEWLRLLREASKGNNPFLNKISELTDLSEQISLHKEKLTDLKSKGFVPLNMVQRFEKAGMGDEYHSMYNSLCNNTHPNIRALIERHLEIEGDSFVVVMYKDIPLDDFLPEISTVTSRLIDSSIGIHKAFDSKALSRVQSLSKEYSDWISMYLGET